jgi:hypothetical protein
MVENNILTANPLWTYSLHVPRKKVVFETVSDTDVPSPEATPFSLEPPVFASPFDEKPKREKRLGVFIPFNPDGSLDEKRLKGDYDKIDQVKRALNLAPGAATEQVKSGMEVSNDFVRGMYSAVEMLLQRAGVLFLKWPHELASGMKYSEEQKDKLTPPTKALIEKLAPTWLVKHQEIATFAVVFTAVTQEMVQNALVQYVRNNPQMVQAGATETKPNGSHVEGDALAQPVQ